MWKTFAGKRRGPGEACVYFPERVANRPDPCIYSQFLLMNLNQPVTWDNPDVALRLGGIEQYTYDLTTSTDYEVDVTVHNASRRKSALGTEVRLGWIEFGAGAEVRHPIGSTFVDVGVWPATASAVFGWQTPATAGHYCLEVELAHPNDGNPANNRGWNNTQVHQAHSQVTTPVRVYNRWPRGCPTIREGGTALIEMPLMIGFLILGATLGGAGAVLHTAITSHLVGMASHTRFEAGRTGAGIAIGAAAGLVVGLVRNLVAASWRARRAKGDDRKEQAERHDRERLPCDLVEVAVDSYRFEDGKGKEVDPAAMFANRSSAWPARVEPASFRFADGEAYRDVLLVVDAPDGPGPSEPFNVSVRQGGAPTGGVTVVIERGA